MTCIVALRDSKNQRTIIGADSAGIKGFNLNVRLDPKVFKKTKPDMLLGFTASFRMGQLLYYSTFPEPESNTQDSHEYLVTSFIPFIRDLFERNGINRKEDNVDYGGEFIVAYKARIFTIGADYQVAENSYGYAAIGCGEEYALGSLYSTRWNTGCSSRVSTALKAAAKFSIGVSEPFRILTIDWPEDYLDNY